MQRLALPYSKIPQLSSFDQAYQAGDQRLRPFYAASAKIDSFGPAIQQRQFSAKRRALLVQELQAQYANLEQPQILKEQLAALGQEKTFTVTTGHQPNLFTGPLYFVYKILGTIRLAEELKTAYPQYHFVPVYWLGEEDHDFEEINHTYLFGRPLVWEDHQGGPLGQYDIESLAPVLSELFEILGDSPEAQELKTSLQAAFSGPKTYGQAFMEWVHALFGRYGLVVLRAGSPALKASFAEVMKEELLQQTSKAILEKSYADLETAGFGPQAYARDINLFYLSPNRRSRIIQNEAGDYQILDTDLYFSESEILAELEQHPEHFSPNVILRPLYQEQILPNLAYIGGGGELAYWMERKAQFAHYQTPFPILVRRNSVQLIDARSAKNWLALGFDWPQLFEETEPLRQDFVRRQTEHELNFEAEQAQIKAIFEQIGEKTAAVDPTLKASVAAQEAQIQKSLDKLQKRLMRAEKQKMDTELAKIQKLQHKLLPKGKLQERCSNFMEFYLRLGGQKWLSELLQELNPLQKDFLLLFEED